MKQDPALRDVMGRLAPGVLTRAGFLGNDARRLEDILDADRAVLAQASVSPEDLAARLKALYDRARAGLGAPVGLGDGIIGMYREAMGRVPCPWRGCGVFEKGEVVLTDTRTGETLRLSTLGIHLIGAHGFFQGRGAPYRIEPSRAVWLVRRLSFEGP